uniref:Tr-type G domain-containing protein n=1 Tax=Malurus cyaneus samueli TaxID=2593467 RepID=A0A8C5T3G1_9PASS
MRLFNQTWSPQFQLHRDILGVLGHIDSGKTALARALSTTGSTAAFDRAPQSRARGITLDLGFSCLRTALPPQLGPGPGELQFTLVDCPGHASLIRTIIGGKGVRHSFLPEAPNLSGVSFLMKGTWENLEISFNHFWFSVTLALIWGD